MTPPFPTLTPRAITILHLLSFGLQNKEIARLLGSSYRTVEVHRGRILSAFRELSGHPTLTTSGIITRAISLGIIPFPDTSVHPLLAATAFLAREGIARRGSPEGDRPLSPLEPE